jgi:hypothetical protein
MRAACVMCGCVSVRKGGMRERGGGGCRVECEIWPGQPDPERQCWSSERGVDAGEWVELPIGVYLCLYFGEVVRAAYR